MSLKHLLTFLTKQKSERAQKRGHNSYQYPFICPSVLTNRTIQKAGDSCQRRLYVISTQGRLSGGSQHNTGVWGILPFPSPLCNASSGPTSHWPGSPPFLKRRSFFFNYCNTGLSGKVTQVKGSRNLCKGGFRDEKTGRKVTVSGQLHRALVTDSIKLPVLGAAITLLNSALSFPQVHMQSGMCPQNL